MRKNIVLLTLLLTCSSVFAQVTAKPLKKVSTLSMPGETGANGASVAWHPGLKKYYASFAGNMTFPFAVFDASGILLSPDTLIAMVDMRGMWYNTVSKKIEANGYGENGWVRYILNTSGIPEDTEELQEGQVQPGEHSVGVFDAVTKRISFLSEGQIFSYSFDGEELDEIIELKIPGQEELAEGELEDVASIFEKNYSTSTLCYTGIVNAEFALLNHELMQIELYSRKGILTKAFKIPDDMPLYTNFNFAYANSTWWLFDKESRKWFGFK